MICRLAGPAAGGARDSYVSHSVAGDAPTDELYGPLLLADRDQTAGAGAPRQPPRSAGRS